MNLWPLDPKPVEDPTSTVPIERQVPRGNVIVSREMATTLPLTPLAHLPSLTSPYGDRHFSQVSQLPPPFSTGDKAFIGRESTFDKQGSSTSSPNSGKSLSTLGHQSHLVDSQQPQARKRKTSPDDYGNMRITSNLGRPTIERHVDEQPVAQMPARGTARYANDLLPHPYPQPGVMPVTAHTVTNPTTSSSNVRAIQRPPAAYGAPPTTSAYSRFRLHIRQQPRAARAGPDGKDRRTIDPPPVLQILIEDFNLDTDLKHLKAQEWVVHTKLVSAQSPHEDVSIVTAQNADRGPDPVKITRLLLGTMVSSPFFCSDDPHPQSAPKHPSSRPERPPSPSDRLIKPKPDDAYKTYPGAFFIFADLSVRKAGQYRLEFRLMKMEPSVLVPGAVVPTISTAVSDVFNVVNAKDFDQVQPSTDLVRGLLDRGAGFPLKLKKGLREGQRPRRRGQPDDLDDDDNDDNDEDDDEDED